MSRCSRSALKYGFESTPALVGTAPSMPDEQADVHPGRLPGELDARHRVLQPARVDEPVGGVEAVDALEEEGPLLGEEEGEALVARDLPHIGLDVGEVGVHGGVEREVGAHAPAQVAPHLRIGAVAPGVAPVGRAVQRRGHGRREVDHHAPGEVAQADQPPRLAEERCGAPQRGRPGVGVPRVLHLADDVDAPALHVGRLVADALEGDVELDLVAVVGEPAPRIEDVVRREVGLAHLHAPARPPLFPLGAVAVLLDAERVDAEEEGLAPVVEGVEEELDVVVALDPVAVGERGVDRSGGVEGPDAEVDARRRIPDQDLGGVGGRPLVHGLVLGEAGEHRGGEPRGLVQEPVDVGVLLQARHGDLGLACEPGVRRLRFLHRRRRAERAQEDGQHRFRRMGGIASPAGVKSASRRALGTSVACACRYGVQHVRRTRASIACAREARHPKALDAELAIIP